MSHKVKEPLSGLLRENGVIMVMAMVAVSVMLVSVAALTISVQSALRSSTAELNYHKAILAAESGLNSARSQLSTIPIWTQSLNKESLYHSTIPRPLILPIDAKITITKTATDIYSIANLNNGAGRAIIKQRYQINGTTPIWGNQSKL